MCYREFGSFTENKEKLGRELKPCKNEGNEISQSIVASRGHIIIRRTVRSIQTSKLHSETEKRKRIILDEIILKKLGELATIPISPADLDHVLYYDGVKPDIFQLPEDNDLLMPYGATFFEKPITDQWIHAERNLYQEEMLHKEKFIGRTTNGNGDAPGSCDPNTFLNTLTYDVEFSNGEIKEYLANVIAENVCSQVDEDDNNIKILCSIVDHRK